MPIFGDFIRKVLDDKRFSKYKAKFAEPKDIDPKLWAGSDYVQMPDSILSEDSENEINSEDNATPNNSETDTQTEVSTTEE